MKNTVAKSGLQTTKFADRFNLNQLAEEF